MSVTGRIFSVTRGSFHDGPGVRTVVYMKGCPLHCIWCHNPEGQETEPQLNYIAVKCMGCSTCVDTCPQGNFSVENGKLHINRDNCTGCGACVDACPTGSLSFYGDVKTVDEVMTQLMRDAAYYTNGGVTFSGGECLCQPDFLETMLLRLRELSVHTLLETALQVPATVVARICPLASEVYADIKHFDSDRHEQLTGGGNELILSNIRLLGRLGVPFMVRTPLIPGCNDETDNLIQSARFARDAGAKRYVILPYNPLGESKYEPIGRTFTLSAMDKQNEETLTKLCETLNAALGTTDFVIFQK